MKSYNIYMIDPKMSEYGLDTHKLKFVDNFPTEDLAEMWITENGERCERYAILPVYERDF